jgi:hypothetical protein
MKHFYQQMTRSVLWLTVMLLTIGQIADAIDGQIAPSLDYSFPDRWSKTISSSMPKLLAVKTVVAEQPFLIYTFISNYDVDSQNTADVSIRFKLITSAGEIYHESADAAALSGKIANPSFVQLSNAFPFMAFDTTAECGVYSIECVLHDKISNQKASLHTTINLAKFERANWDEKGLSELDKWIQRYYLNPKPIQALEAFIESTKFELSNSVTIMIYGFFREVFLHNQFLMPTMLEFYPTQNDKTKRSILILMYYMSYTADDFMEGLPPYERDYADGLMDYENPYDDSLISSGSDMDICWVRFFASGGYEPVLRVVNMLKHHKHVEDLDQYKNSDKSEEAKIRANLGAMYIAAKKSLKANLRKHALVRDYCQYMLTNEQLSKDTHDQLKDILGQ